MGKDSVAYVIQNILQFSVLYFFNPTLAVSRWRFTYRALEHIYSTFFLISISKIVLIDVKASLNYFNVALSLLRN